MDRCKKLKQIAELYCSGWSPFGGKSFRPYAMVLYLEGRPHRPHKVLTSYVQACGSTLLTTLSLSKGRLPSRPCACGLQDLHPRASSLTNALLRLHIVEKIIQVKDELPYISDVGFRIIYVFVAAPEDLEEIAAWILKVDRLAERALLRVFYRAFKSDLSLF